MGNLRLRSMELSRRCWVVLVLALVCVGSAEVLNGADMQPEELLRGGSIDPILSLVETGEEISKDECAGAYKKFGANIKAMEVLKAKATKKATEADRKAKSAEAKLKVCADGQKEVLVKADWKKARIDAKIKLEVEKKTGKKVSKLKKGEKKEVKKLKKKADKAVKKETKALAKAKDKAVKKETKVKAAKSKEKSKVKQVKTEIKAKEKAAVKKDVKLKVLKATKKAKGKEKKKEEKKIKKVKKTAKKEPKKAIKDEKATVKKIEKATIEKVKEAAKVTPPSIQKEVVKEKVKAKSEEKEVKAVKSELAKESDAAKDKEKKMETTQTELKDSQKDTAVKLEVVAKEKKAQDGKLLEDKITGKADKTKINDLQVQMNAVKEMEPAVQEKAKAEASKLALLESQLNDTKQEATKKDAALTILKAQMSSGQGELISQIEMLKKESSQKENTISGLKRRGSKLSLDKQNMEAKFIRAKIKSRTTGASLYKTEQTLATAKQDLANLHTSHAKLKDKYTSTRPKRELAEGRLRDAAGKHLECSESMRRLKQYNEDTITEQRRKIESLTSSVSLEKEKLRAVEVSRSESKKTKKIAAQAAKAASTQAALQATPK